MTRAEVIERVRKLQKLSHGSTFDNEKDVARKAAQKLITEHRLTLAELVAADGAQSVPPVATDHPDNTEPNGFMFFDGVKIVVDENWNINVAVRNDVAATPLGRFLLFLGKQS